MCSCSGRTRQTCSQTWLIVCGYFIAVLAHNPGHLRLLDQSDRLPVHSFHWIAHGSACSKQACLFLPYSSLINPDRLLDRTSTIASSSKCFANAFMHGCVWDQDVLLEVGLVRWSQVPEPPWDKLTPGAGRPSPTIFMAPGAGWQRKQVEGSDRILALGTAIGTVNIRGHGTVRQCFKHWIGTGAALRSQETTRYSHAERVRGQTHAS